MKKINVDKSFDISIKKRWEFRWVYITIMELLGYGGITLHRTLFTTNIFKNKNKI